MIPFRRTALALRRSLLGSLRLRLSPALLPIPILIPMLPIFRHNPLPKHAARIVSPARPVHQVGSTKTQVGADEFVRLGLWSGGAPPPAHQRHRTLKKLWRCPPERGRPGLHN